jgi:type IV pilus assembly protein PilC
LPETFENLEHYFETVLESRRAFLKAMTWPAFMAVSAVTVVALLILIMGILPGGFDPIGLGTGPGSAAAFVIIVAMAASVVGFLGLKLREDESARAALEGAVLPIPGLGDCVRAFALQRFSLAMEMATEAGMRVDRAVGLAFRAAANQAYGKHADRAGKQIRSGRTVTEVLSGVGPPLFPRDYLDVVRIGEETGQLAEVMKTLSHQYRDEAARKLKTLTMIAGGVVYAGVALLVIAVIFRIALAIGGIYAEALRGL